MSKFQNNLKTELKSFNNVFEFFQFQKIYFLSPGFQISFISLLYVITTLGYNFAVQSTGKMDGYSPGVSLLFVPIYEELIFRGVGLKYFEDHYGKIRAIIFTSILFGLWHLKNIFWLSPEQLQSQIIYTALVFSPITCLVTLKFRSLWPAVILHFLNNFPVEEWLRYMNRGS